MKLINLLLFLFIVLIAIIIAHDGFSIYQWNQNVKREVQNNLEYKLTIAHSVLLNELDKFTHTGHMVGELHSKIVPLIEYDKYKGIETLLKNISTLHQIDLMFLLDDERNIVAANRPFNSGVSQKIPLDGTNGHAHLVTYPSAILAGYFRLPKLTERLFILAIQVQVEFQYDNGDPAGKIVMLKMINFQNGLVQRMAELADAEIIIYNRAKEMLIGSFTTQPQAIASGVQDETGVSFSLQSKTIRNLRNEQIAELVVAVNDNLLQKKYTQLGVKGFLPLIITLILAGVLIFVLKKYVFDYIKILIKALQKVANGDLETRVPTIHSRGNEVTSMLVNFNLTMQRLQHFYTQLQNSRSQLENVNDQLMAEIQERKKAERAAAQANQAKTQLLGVAAHDIRSPLGGVLANLEILQDNEIELPESVRQECIETAYTAVNQLLTLANDMLDTSVIETGELKLQRQAGYLQPLIEQRLKIYALLAKTNQVRLHCQYQHNPLVYMDKNRVIQVFDNLIHNAIKFSREEGEIQVRLEQIDGFAWVSIINLNPTEAELETGSETLVAIENCITHKAGRGEKSTGLGLAIAKKIIQRHQGRFFFDNNANPQTSAKFTIPIFIS